MNTVVRVALAEDSYLVREGMVRILNSLPNVELVSVCEDQEELLAAVTEDPPDIVLTDIRMPPTNVDEGIAIAEILRVSHPEMGVLVLSQIAEPDYVVRLLKGGSARRGYFLKDQVADRAKLERAIVEIASGGSAIDPKVVEMLIAARTSESENPLNHLTPRELDVLAAIARGSSNTAIAAELFLSKGAVEKHINSIFAKLPLPDEADASRRVHATLLYLSQQSPTR